ARGGGIEVVQPPLAPSRKAPAALDPSRVVRRWSRVDADIDPRTAEIVVQALLQPVAIDGFADALFAFAPDLDVSLESLRALRRALHAELGYLPLDAPTVRGILGRYDGIFAAVAERAVSRAEALTFRDPLTGLGNRRAAMADLQGALAHAARHERVVTVAMIDLDGLKRINDTSGHAAGDDAIRQMATAMRARARVDDGTYRIGGDEFVIISPDSTGDELGRLLERVAATAPSFSVGIATAPIDGEAPEALLEVADRRLYLGKPPRPTAAPARKWRLDSSHITLGAGIAVSVAAELLRRLLHLSTSGGRAAIWTALLLSAPALFALVVERLAPRRSRREDLARVAALVTVALMVALVLIAD
ncbi:MAG: hypothetical protein QOI47_858, partial [Actinomycetota bacterium]|nr:hypothetical protein [Actinomycetota bacterium]